MITIGQDEKQIRNILQKDNQKRDKKIQQKHISHCSLKQNCEKVGMGLEAGGKKMNIYLKLKKENNVRTMVLEICS